VIVPVLMRNVSKLMHNIRIESVLKRWILSTEQNITWATGGVCGHLL
jgi:hypothetical protein